LVLHFAANSHLQLFAPWLSFGLLGALHAMISSATYLAACSGVSPSIRHCIAKSLSLSSDSASAFGSRLFSRVWYRVRHSSFGVRASAIFGLWLFIFLSLSRAPNTALEPTATALCARRQIFMSMFILRSVGCFRGRGSALDR
jgi:hypothetical protein